MNPTTDQPFVVNAEPPTAPAGAPEAGGKSEAVPLESLDEQTSMETVRDLLFGKKSKEIGDQISGLERRFAAALGDFEKRIQTRLDSLEQFVRGEIASANERYEKDRAALAEHGRETGEKLKGLNDMLNERISRLESNLGRVESETRTQIFERAKSLSDLVGDSSRHLQESLDREIGALKDNVTRKNELGEMLIELGMRITPETGDNGSPGD